MRSPSQAAARIEPRRRSPHSLFSKARPCPAQSCSSQGIGFFVAVVLGLILQRVVARIGTIRALPWLAPGAALALGWNAFAWRAVMVGHLGETT